MNPARKVALVVDDESSVRTYIKTVLEPNGFQIIEAEDGIQALTLMRKVGDVDVVIADICMPNMDGIELAHLLGAEFPKIPIVLVSGYSAGMPDAAIEYIHKPFSPEALLSAVKKVIAESGASAE